MKLPVAVQLYSLRHEMEHDFVGILEKVAELGLDGVEFAGFGGLSAEELKGHLDRLGLVPVSTHTGWKDLVERYDETIAYHRTIGCKNIVIPGYGFPDEEAYATAVKIFNEIGRKLKADGFSFYYHNHGHEFTAKIHGKYIMEGLLEDCREVDLLPEIDTYWAHEAGIDPAAFIRAHKPPLIHLKDGNGGNDLTAIGEGKNTITEILDAAVETGVQWVIIENDDPKPDGITDLARSMENLKNKFHFN
ncbi:MAG TPA: sugar phosphate isomerase/epimerase [Candidatus Eisenbergiella merdipullorum]|uniref:Sugar phosphate isomerase/epimerase n=1 Tax=Candidatus Eisenbergiella merdipullorum TaxID=2838553 RepID=A0A9D2I6V6_9FIRM|nr:sugar phosphate isomerase/epimerase [Candidatus Eisenbergiella merdipullorum]